MQTSLYTPKVAYSFNMPKRNLEYKYVGVKIEGITKKRAVQKQAPFFAQEFSFDDFLI